MHCAEVQYLIIIALRKHAYVICSDFSKLKRYSLNKKCDTFLCLLKT